MFKFVTLYRRVDDENALETFFSSVHLPLAEQLPNLLQREVSRVSHKPGGESRFHLMFEVYFATEDHFREAMASPVGLRLIQALMPWAEKGIITWFYATAFAEAMAVDEEE